MQSQPLLFLWNYCKYFKSYFLIMLFCLIIWAINEALFPYFIKLMVDQAGCIIPGQYPLWQSFKTPIIGIGITWIVMECAMRLYGILELKVMPKLRALIRNDVFDHAKQHSFKFFLDNLAGSLGTKIQDIRKSSHHIVDHLFWSFFAKILAIAFATAIVWMHHTTFGLIMLIWLIVHFSFIFLFIPDILKKNAEHYEGSAQLSGETIDVLSNIFSVKLFGRTQFETDRLNKGAQKREIFLSERASWAIQKMHFFCGTGGVLFIFVITYFLLQGWQHQWLSIGDFPLITMSCFNIMGLVWQMSHSVIDFFQDLGTLKGALRIFATPRQVIDKENATQINVNKGQIIFDHITFGYNLKKPLFKNLCITILAGEKVGLVGFSGSGKTSLVNLLLRGFDLNGGKILIDDQDISSVQQESLRRVIGTVSQDPGLFHRSIMDNIRYGRLDATDAEVMEAAIKAHCHEFIIQLEHGYHTIVGERGLKLSGGQRQRLSIARAFLKNAPILVLDEATSALDSLTERYIHESFQELMVGKTVIVIAHRLSTLNAMDRILYFHHGQLLEDGSPHELLIKNGYFAKLWALQQEGFIPEKNL